MVAMSIAPAAPGVAATAEAARRTARVVGVDIARCLALLGMMATHILPNVDLATFSFVPWHQQVAGGRSAALFAVLAGVSLALVTGRQQRFRGRRLAAARAGIVLRAAVIAVIGLILGSFDSGVAVILAYYGLLFLLALPFLGLSWRVLAVLAGVWAIAAPILSQLIRPHLPPPTYQAATFDRLVAEPHLLLADLTFTGYYPTVSWLAYVLAGLAVGRLALDELDVARNIALVGGGLALATWASSRLMTKDPVVVAILEETLPRSAVESRYVSPPGSLDLLLAHGFFGTTPTTSWWWLSIVAPHSTTPFDLLHTIGTSLLVLGLALMVGRLAPRVLGIVFAAGTMTLTLYSLHVIALAAGLGPERGPELYWLHVGFVLIFGAVWRTFVGQGPLEWVTARAAKLGSSAVLALPAGPNEPAGQRPDA
jgi:uncharacterized membrane protein